MQLRTLNPDKLIALYGIKEVTSHVIDTSKGTLLDPEIFGYRGESGPLKFGYIDLKGPYIDPSTYAIATRVFRELPSIVNASKKFSIKNGTLVEDENGSTGLSWFYEHFDEIEFKDIKEKALFDNTRLQSKLMKKAFVKLKKSDFFIEKLIVLPLRYRDIDLSRDNQQLNEINQYYIDLIKLVSTKHRLNMKQNGVIDSRIQDTLEKIYEYMSNSLFRKGGAQRQGALGRSVDNSSLTVITAPEIRPEEIIGEANPLNTAHMPLHHIMNMSPVQTLTSTKMVLNMFYNLGLIHEEKEDFDYYYTKDKIQELVEQYASSPALRLVPLKDSQGNPIVMYFKWTDVKGNTDIHKRYITLMELFSLAYENYKNNIRAQITRYPVTQKGSCPFMKLEASVLNTEKGTLEIYKDDDDLNDNRPFSKLEHYPNISSLLLTSDGEYKDLSDLFKKPSVFEEATKFSNLYLDGLNGDYDGDRVLTKSVFSKEAIEQVDKFNKSPIAHLNIDGTNMRNIGNEAIQGLFNLTTDKYSARIRDKIDFDIDEKFNKDGYTLEEIMQILSKYNPGTPIHYNNIDTTLGRIIFNKVVFSHVPKFEFVNKTMTKGNIKKLLNKCSALVTDNTQDWYTMDEHLKVLDKVHDLGFGICDVVASSLDYNMLVADDSEFNRKKKEVFKDIQEIVKNNDGVALQNIEQEMVDFSKEYYKDNQMSDMYDSGAKPTWGNDFKTMKISLGVTPIPGTSDYTIVENNLKDGLKNKDMLANTNLQIYGAYNKTVEVRKGGYQTKLMQNLSQSTVVRRGNCGSTKYLKVNESNPNDLLYRYVNDNGHLIMITNENVNKYLNRDIEMRTPIYCRDSKAYCSTCTGEMLFHLYASGDEHKDQINVGLYIADIGNSILNKYMKKTHDLTQKMYEIKDLDDYII